MPRVGPRMFLAVLGIKAVISMCLHPLHAEMAPGSSTVAADAAELSMPVKDHGFKLGDVIVLAHADGSIRIEGESFLSVIGRVLRPAALQKLQDNLPKTKYLEPSALSAAGLPTTYDSTALEITIQPTVEQRPRGEIAGTMRGNNTPADLAQPAILSGFLNTHFGVVYGRAEDRPGTVAFPAAVLEGAARWNGFVVEGEAQLGSDGTFARQNSRLVYDIPEDTIRVSAGDIALGANGSLSVPPLLGVAIEKTYATLQPSRNIRPTGKRTFRVERHSEVQVIVNGHEVRRLHLSPGEYDLSDLPLTSGTNDVKLKIKDEFGKEEFVDFSILFNRTLLNPGISEWSLTGGIKTNSGPLSPGYDDEIPLMSAIYRRGLSDTLTGSLSAQGTIGSGLLGANGLVQTPLGLLSVDAALSAGRDAAFGWSGAGELTIDTDEYWETLGSLQVGMDIMSADFMSSLSQVPAAGGRVRVSGSVSQPLPAGISASLSGYYQIAEMESDRGFGGSVSLNRAVSNDMTIGIAGGYENRAEAGRGEFEGLSLVARLNYRPSAGSFSTLQRDGLSGKTTGAVGSDFRDGASRGSLDVALEHTPGRSEENAQNLASADFNYANSRIEANASHAQQFERLGTRVTSRRTSVNAGTGIAFADGNVAFGRPVRGGFVIVTPHKSLSESTVRLGASEDQYQAASDGLGPLLVSDLSAYAPTSLSYDVDDLPPGYDLGSGTFAFLAPLKAGYGLTIGSDFAVTALGFLKDAEGKPVPLKAGTILVSEEAAKKIVTFTNAEGRFSVQGLKAGEWTLKLQDEPSLQYLLKIPADASGFVELGELQPKS